MSNGFVVLDFGSQLTQLIARRLRELNFYSEILPFDAPLEKIKKGNPAGIILSGGPSSVYEKGAPSRSVEELLQVAPLMGICYGMQLICHQLGGKVGGSEMREYGSNTVTWKALPGMKMPMTGEQKVWMSHGDIVEEAARGCQVIASSKSNHPAAMVGERIFAVQFHPEVVHTEHGIEILKYFTDEICRAQNTWTAPKILGDLQNKLRAQVPAGDHILVGLSGGVDSSVVASLLTKTFSSERVHCVFVNNGLLRKDEYAQVLRDYENMGLNVVGVDASQEFLSALRGLVDPEQKRKAIGRVFIEVFEKAIHSENLRNKNIQWLAQGTLYPDVIESVSSKGGPSHTIKSHHNVGGLPERMKLGLIEPVRELFKDEVRKIGAELGLAEKLIARHPFPGPGLSIRIMGEVSEENLSVLRDADEVFISFLREKNLYHKIWQAFCVLLPVKTVGVQGDGRTYEKVLALRAVTSIDGMTADWFPFEFDFLREVSSRITNQVRGINRVVYDITSKPPGTIEWE
jgi:GMP synthase (glutamine-hydrolysing)